MLIKAQIQFIKQQIEQLEELRRQTGATRTELTRRAVDYYVRGIREHGVQKVWLPLPTSDTREKPANHSGPNRPLVPRTLKTASG